MNDWSELRIGWDIYGANTIGAGEQGAGFPWLEGKFKVPVDQTGRSAQNLAFLAQLRPGMGQPPVNEEGTGVARATPVPSSLTGGCPIPGRS